MKIINRRRIISVRNSLLVGALIVFLFHSHVFAAPDNLVDTEDWSQATGLGWPNGSALAHTFTNYKGSGIDMTMTFSADDWDNDIAGNDDAPNIYTTNGALSSGADYEPAPNAAYDGALRWTTNWFDNNGVGIAGAADGPRLVTLAFSQPVYIDDFEIGSISTDINGSGSDEQFQIIANVQGGGTAFPDATGQGNLGSAGTAPSLGPIIDRVNGATYIRGTQSQMTGNYGHVELSYTSQPITSMTMAFYCAQSPVSSVPTGDSNDCQGSATINLLTISSIPVTTGSLDITKTVTGGTDPQNFSLQLDCSDDAFDNNMISLVNGATHTVNNIPTGTTCSVTETTPTPPAGFSYGTAVIAPANVTIGDGTTVSISVTNPLTQSPVCSIGSTVNTTCNNNNTLSDPSDDTFSYTINATGTNAGASFSISGDNIQNNLSYGTDHIFQPFPIAGGDLNLTLTDVTTASCTQSPVVVSVPATCSSTTSQVDIELTKTVTPTSVTSGDTVVYTLTVNNTSSTDATGVVVSDPLPAGITYVSDDGGATTSESNGTVTWNLGNMNANSNATLNITVIVN